MRFEKLSNYFAKLESISSRLQLRAILLDLLKQLTVEESQIVSYFLQGRLAPPFVSVEFNIAEKLLEKYIKERFHIKDSELSELKLQYKDIAGAYEYLANKTSSVLEKSPPIIEVYEVLLELALIEGAGAINRKLTALDTLLRSLDAKSGKYVLRLIQGRLRLGASVRSILDALSYDTSLQTGTDIKEIKKVFDRAYGLTSDIGYITALYKSEGFNSVQKIRFFAGIPIAPQLAEREKSLKKCLERIPLPLVDPKMDGLRGQIHIFDAEYMASPDFKDRVWFNAYQRGLDAPDNNLLGVNRGRYFVKIFSRNLEDLTPMFPEVLEWVQKFGDEFFSHLEKGDPKVAVLDSELIGYNENTGEFFGFQVTMTRRRKYGVKQAMQDVPIRAFVFDLMVYGKELLLEPLKKRRSLAEKIFADLPSEGTIVLNTAHKFYELQNSSTVLEDVEKLFYDYVSRGIEGIMIKDPESPYEPGVRKFTWIKFKRAMKHELADTVDVVVLGYYYGKGRLASLGIGGLLVGVYDKENDQYVTIAKVGTGLTDDDWRNLKQALDDLAVDKPPVAVKVPKELTPDVWVYPQLVVEIEADEITKSPIHTAGVALRFPRYKRIREDKGVEDITTLQEILEMMKG